MRIGGSNRMTTIAYIANEFPSPLEPYVMDEIAELRRRGTRVICYSGKRVSPENLALSERAFWKETRFFQPLSDDELKRAVRRLISDRSDLWQLVRPLVWERGASLLRRIRALGHTVMGPHSRNNWLSLIRSTSTLTTDTSLRGWRWLPRDC
jgi:hypothetical protein